MRFSPPTFVEESSVRVFGGVGIAPENPGFRLQNPKSGTERVVFASKSILIMLSQADVGAIVYGYEVGLPPENPVF